MLLLLLVLVRGSVHSSFGTRIHRGVDVSEGGVNTYIHTYILEIPLRSEVAQDVGEAGRATVSELGLRTHSLLPI